MINILPGYYRKSQVVKDLYDVITTALERIGADISELERNMFIATTSDFVRHESDVGLASATVDAETKRARVISRLQGTKLLTLSELKRIVTDYDKTGCTIEEDYENYTVTIIFSSRKGQPYNFEQIRTTIDELKPAHILINYEFMKNTWANMRDKLGIWANAHQFTWSGIKVYDGRTWLYVENGKVYLREDGANAYVAYVDNAPYARML